MKDHPKVLSFQLNCIYLSPDVLVLCLDGWMFRVLIPIPVLAAAVHYPTVSTLQDVAAQAKHMPLISLWWTSCRTRLRCLLHMLPVFFLTLAKGASRKEGKNQSTNKWGGQEQTTKCRFLRGEMPPLPLPPRNPDSRFIHCSNFSVFHTVIDTYPDQAYLASPVHPESLLATVCDTTTLSIPLSRHVWIKLNEPISLFVEQSHKRQHIPCTVESCCYSCDCSGILLLWPCGPPSPSHDSHTAHTVH